jgi:colicin import membrane protein
MMQEGLAAEQQAAENARIQSDVATYSARIQQRVKRYWNRPSNVDTGLVCTLKVSILSNGEVKQATVVKGSGNAVFDRSAVAAVHKAAPFPLPADPKAAAKFRDFTFNFKPQ